ncbi:MAG: hypothetical protein IT406_03300 [Candidatus Yanofskybacteria bacterium]|nr:hypothetical protein [Candidatus Yanofskybacteria bacterium]
MPIEFRRMMGVVSFALFALFFAMAIGASGAQTDAASNGSPLTFPFILFCAWVLLSAFAKIGMLLDEWDWWPRALAVLSSNTLIILLDIGGRHPNMQNASGAITLALLLFTWYLVDIIDLFTPRTWWKKSS